MVIELTAEAERVVAERLRSQSFATPEELILDALAAQSAEERSLVQDRDALQCAIEQGMGEIDRVEGITLDEMRSRLKERKAAWRLAHDAR